MGDIWVTPRTCSECLSRHDEDDYGEECDCWCHEDPAWTTASPGAGDDWEW